MRNMIFFMLICDDTISYSLNGKFYYLGFCITQAQFGCWFSHTTGFVVLYESIRFILPSSTICVGGTPPKNVFHRSLMYGNIRKLKHFFIWNSPCSPLKKNLSNDANKFSKRLFYEYMCYTVFLKRRNHINDSSRNCRFMTFFNFPIMLAMTKKIKFCNFEERIMYFFIKIEMTHCCISNLI